VGGEGVDPTDHGDARFLGDDVPSRQLDEIGDRPPVRDFSRMNDGAGRPPARPGSSWPGSPLPRPAAASGNPAADPQRPAAAPARPLTGPPRSAAAPRVRIPGERCFRDGDRVSHARFGDGVVVTSKLTRTDEEVTVAFKAGGVKTLLASIANLEPAG